MKEDSSVSNLLNQVQQLQQEMITLYKKQIQDLIIKIAILEEENKQLKKDKLNG